MFFIMGFLYNFFPIQYQQIFGKFPANLKDIDKLANSFTQ